MCELLRLMSRFCLAILFIGALFCSCDKLPEEVDVKDIPDYYFDNYYLDNRVESINNAIEGCSGDYEAFFWITDMHWEPDLNTRRSPSLIKYINGKTGIDLLLNGGDTANSQILCKNAIEQLRKAIGTSRVYAVTGNHEINDASRYESPFERVAESLRGHNSNVKYGDEDRCYFYVDNHESKTRLVGLSSFGLYLDGRYDSCYTSEQLFWFTNTALAVPAGWTLVIFTHTLYDVDVATDELRTGVAGAEGFIKAIDSYEGNGTIACVLMGHTHRDRIHIGSSGVPYIISASDRYATYKGDINVERIPGTISEQHFEVVVLDKTQREIKLFSIGARARDGYEDEAGKEVDVRIVKY